MLGPLQFVNEVKQRIHAPANVPGIADPLMAIVEIVRGSPHTLESRTLSKTVEALCRGSVLFRPAEIFALDKTALALVAALGDEWTRGRYDESTWRLAAATLRVFQAT